MKKSLLSFFFLFTILWASVSAQETADEINLIAVMELSISGISGSEALVLTDFISSLVQKTGRFRVIDRAEQEKLLKEQEFSLSGCVDESCIIEAGKMLAAKYIITGSTGSFGERYLLNLKLLDVETSEAINTASGYYDDMEDILEESENLLNELLDFEGSQSISEYSSSDKEQKDNDFIKPVPAGFRDKKIKFGHLSVSTGYYYFPLQTYDTNAVFGITSIPADHAYVIIDDTGAPVATANESVHITQNSHLLYFTLGYEYPFFEKISLGGFLSYAPLLGTYFSFFNTDFDQEYNDSEYRLVLADITDPLNPVPTDYMYESVLYTAYFAIGLSGSFIPGEKGIGFDFGLGIDTFRFLLIKSGLSYQDFFLKVFTALPLNLDFNYDLWKPFGIISGMKKIIMPFGIEIGYTFKF